MSVSRGSERFIISSARPMALVAEARWPARTRILLFRLAPSSVDHIVAGNKVEFQVENQ